MTTTTTSVFLQLLLLLQLLHISAFRIGSVTSTTIQLQTLLPPSTIKTSLASPSWRRQRHQTRLAATQTQPTLIEVLKQDPNFSTFASLLDGVPDLKDRLSDSDLGRDSNILTIFAPNNAVFSKLDKQIMFKLGKKDNLPILRKIVRFHVIEEVLTKNEIAKVKELSTLALIPVSVKPDGGSFKLNEASIIRTIDTCSNGILHEVDGLVCPFLLFRYLV